ncbi:unnamed protein product [Urochloa decumbens]|uniref:DUF7595 domain-containing protein n=1 Tax=Urochloa decumbens TaxID=240449 RepID=A0ABC8YK87_9POAL
MSSPKRRRVGPLPSPRDGGSGGQLPNNSDPPFIPADLVVEILARSDTKTVVRGAATCKHVRRAIAGPDFLRRVALAPRAAGGGFDPGLLLGASCAFEQGGYSGDAFFQEQRRPFTFDADELYLYEPMVSRGCLAVLHHRGRMSADVRVVNCLTGQQTRVKSQGTATSSFYPRALLAVGDGGRSFQLLVAGKDLTTRIFSSEHGRWGDRVQTRLDPPAPKFLRTLPNRLSPPCVIGDTVHWLCKEKGIVALNVGAALATVIELPPKCFTQVKSCPKGMDKGLLACTADGRLSLLVAEAQVISMWTLSAASWSRQVVIHRHAIGGGAAGPGVAVRFLPFGERSGTVMLQMEEVGLVQLDLGSREARVLSDKFKEIGTPTYTRLQLCLHETDFTTSVESITKNMKLF